MIPLRIVFLGRRCAFTRLPFEAILAAGGEIVGLIIPAAAGAGWERQPPPDLPMLPRDVVDRAHAHAIPVVSAGPLNDPAGLAALQALRPDVLCAACFPRRLPPSWLAVPRHGALNIHPARLPAYRGPEPLFWQFRAGDARPGVTVHQMDAGLDTGPVVAQAELTWPDGFSAAEAERLAAEAGGRLLVDVLSAGRWAAHPQPPAGASYFPRPTAEALVIPTTWPARRAFNFMRGAAEWGPFEIMGPAGRRTASTALAFSNTALSAEIRDSSMDWIEFSPGYLLVRP